MKKILPAECLSCGCVSGDMIDVFVSSCFPDWGKYGDAEAAGLTECEVYRNDRFSSQIFMGMCGNAVMITFRGYEKFHHVLDDLERISVPFPSLNSGVRVNAIFLNSYLDLRDHVVEYIGKRKDIRSIYIVGHSLGAAMATLAAAEFSKKFDVMTVCYTFGSPMVGDSWFRKAYNGTVRETHRYVLPLDPVPLFPSGDGYVHVCDGTVIGSRCGQLPLVLSKMKNSFLSMLGLSSKKNLVHVVSNDLGLDDHELYNYAFMVRKYKNDLI